MLDPDQPNDSISVRHLLERTKGGKEERRGEGRKKQRRKTKKERRGREEGLRKEQREGRDVTFQMV